MNLPAHGTASPDPSKASWSVTNNTPSKEQHRFRLARPYSLPGETVPVRLAVFTHRQAPAMFQCSLFPRNRLAELNVPPGAPQCYYE
ncbi:hypothetical protein DEO72_LG8g1426 [Vigna unguiculata]|uniref:Uncharacterized protein n=1 Tax=Vigna unguiculata TaxID=3917 RepID=A0A4D6MS09_VIGUN|nr:hypothetical protein DEO72_LG8g1426 [Vigna unguiculata]